MIESYKIVETLQIIKQIESNGCKNITHQSDAIGCYGLRPIALKQIGIDKPKTTYSELTQDLYAKKYADHILTYADSPSIEFLLYGWLNGPSAAKKRQRKYKDGKIPYRSPWDHWYIKRYNKLNINTRYRFLPIF